MKPLLTTTRRRLGMAGALLLFLLPACLGEPSLPPSPPAGTPAAVRPSPIPTLPPDAPATAAATLPPLAAGLSPTAAPTAVAAAPIPSATMTAAVAAPSPTVAALPPTAAPTATAVPPSPSPQPPSPAPAPLPLTHVTFLANGFGNPDDATADPRNGTIYFGDFANGAINRLAPTGGQPEAVAGGFQEPEGIAVMPDGHLIVVEQKTNRLWTVDPARGTKSLLRQLVNITSQDGVDGIALDPDTGAILVPDSPNGRLLTLSPDGSTLRTIATGFVRPTGVAVLPSGDLLVADEFGNALDRVTRAGRVTQVSTMFQPDDVVVDRQGQAYVNSLGGTIYQVNPATGARTVLLSGLKLPHGLSLDPQGGLVVAEAGRNRIFRLGP